MKNLYITFKTIAIHFNAKRKTMIEIMKVMKVNMNLITQVNESQRIWHGDSLTLRITPYR